jgi:hypothetical protein
MSDHGIEWKRESKMLFSDGILKNSPAFSYQFYANFTQKKWYDFSCSIYSATKLKRLMDAYKKCQISLLDYLNSIAANI